MPAQNDGVIISARISIHFPNAKAVHSFATTLPILSFSTRSQIGLCANTRPAFATSFWEALRYRIVNGFPIRKAIPGCDTRQSLTTMHDVRTRPKRNYTLLLSGSELVDSITIRPGAQLNFNLEQISQEILNHPLRDSLALSTRPQGL